MTVADLVSTIILRCRVSLRREGDLVKLAMPGHRPLTLERLSNRLPLIGHTFDEHRSLVRDPEFLIHTDRGRWTSVSLRRGADLIEALDLDDQDRIIQIDAMKVGEIEKVSEMFVERLLEEGWLTRARVLMAVPRPALPQSVN